MKKPKGPMSNDGKRETLLRRVRAEMVDSFDEELEMEIDEDRLEELVGELGGHLDAAGGIDRAIYFKELFGLQGELVKLQDW